MLKKLTKKALVTGVAASLVGLFGASTDVLAFDSPINHASGALQSTGATQGAIHVISEDNQTWTQIKPGFGFVDFPIFLNITSNPGNHTLNHVWVVQGNALDVKSHAIYDSGSIAPDTQHSHAGTLTGGSLHLSPEERNEIVAACNAGLNQFSQDQSQFETETQVPLTLVMQSVTPDDGISSEGLDWHEDMLTTNFPVKVICEPFTRPDPPLPTDESADLPDPNITQVELGLSTGGAAVVGGPLVYTGSCPMGITLNMRWVTNVGTSLKSYVEHKDVSGQQNWTSTEFSVATNQPAAGGNWKKEMTDFMSIPFAGAVAVNGPGGANAHDISDGSLVFNPGGGSGGFNPATSLGSTNTGNDTGMTQYIGFFRLVAYRNKTIMPALNFDGSVTNTVVYDDKKMSGWRKYIVNCEPETGAVAGGSPTVLVPTNTPDSGQTALPKAPAVVSTGRPKPPAADLAQKRREDARLKAARIERKRITDLKAQVAKRKRDARLKMLKLKAQRDAAKKVAAAAAKRKAIAAALASQKAATAKTRRRATATTAKRKNATRRMVGSTRQMRRMRRR